MTDRPRSRLAPALAPALAAVLFAGAADAAPPVTAGPKSWQQVVADAPASSWQDVAPDDLLVMDLGARGHVVIELAPDFAPAHVANIRALAHAGWWNNGAIVRVQDDYVVQWRQADEHAKLPQGISSTLPAEYDRALAGLDFRALPYPDSYAKQAGDAEGWPVATDGNRAWLTHCYGMVGVGRDEPPDTGDGAELYAVNGQAPRALDRNIALVGRVLGGMTLLSTLPRGTASLGFYATPDAQVPILSVHLASDLPPDARPGYQVMRTGSADFAAFADARATYKGAFLVRPPGGVDVCNVPVPVRVTPGRQG